MASIVSTDAWVTMEEAKDYCNVTDNSLDRRMEKLVNSVTDMAQDLMQRKILTRAYTDEVYDGLGGLVLFLDNWPVTTLTKVEVLTGYTNLADTWEEWHPANATATVEGRHKNSIWFRAVALPKGKRNVRVTYTAGYSKDGVGVQRVPQDLKTAVLETIMDWFKKPDQQIARIQSVSFSGQTVTYLNETFPKTAIAVFDRYTRLAI